MDFTFGKQYHRWLYFIGLMLIAIGLSVSKVVLSIGTIWIGVNWIWEADYGAKFRLLLARKSVFVLIAIFFVHLLGLLWTSDMHEALRDVRVKIPLLVIPFVIGTSAPLNKKQFESLLILFTIGVLIASVRTYLIASGVIHKKFLDLRQASDLVPLIRLALFSALSILFFGRWFIRDKRWFIRLACLAASVWLLIFMVYMQSLTGLVVLLTSTILIAFIMTILNKKRKALLAMLAIFAVGLAYGSYSIGKAYNDFYSLKDHPTPKLLTHSPTGRPYEQQVQIPIYENGVKVMVNTCWLDMMIEWQKRSDVPYHKGRDRKGGYIQFTLVRYLASRDLPRDSVGMSKLSDDEIRDIENGCTNYRDKDRNPLEKRAYQVLWETYNYSAGGDPSGSSIAMRMETIRAALYSIAKRPWIGGGTGCQNSVYNEFYVQSGSRLHEKYRWLHAHNQFLSFAVTFGIPFTIFFVFSLWWPASSMRRWRSYLYLAFFIIVTLSFLDDDTLETQQGVVFFAFFNALFLYAMPFLSSVIPPDGEQKNSDEKEALPK